MEDGEEGEKGRKGYRHKIIITGEEEGGKRGVIDKGHGDETGNVVWTVVDGEMR